METFSLAALFSTASLLLIFLWRSLRLLRPGHASSDTQLQYALALRSAALYVLSGALPLIFPCEQAELGWADCPSHWLIPTNLMRIFHYLPFWYAFLLTPYLGGLASAIHDAILGVGTGLAGASLINLLMPGGAGGPHYLPGEYFERAWLPLRYSTTGAFLFALCFTYGLFFSKLSVGKKQYALGLFSELLVPFMNPQTRTGFRAVCWDWDFSWNWNGAAMCGFWLVLLAVLLSVLTLGLKPWSFQSVERHTALWASANALAQVAEDTAGCLEYLMTILQKDHWKFQFHADSSNFYIRHLGLRRSRAEALLDLVAWEKGLLPSAKQENLLKVAAFLRQLRQLLRIQSEHMRYFGPSFAAGEHLAVEEFLETCSEGLGLVAQDLRQRADLSEETCAELQRLGNRGDKVLLAVVRGFAQEKRSSRHLAFVDKLRSWPKAFRSLSPDAPSAAKPAATPAASDWAERHWFALRNTTSWTLALLWSLYSRNYSCGCVVATSFIFSQTSGSSFDVNINRILGVGMGLAVGNFPALLILDGSTLGSSVCGSFMYFAVMFVMWSLAIFGYLATDSKYFRACLLWAALGGVQMLRHLPRFSRMDVELFMAILDNVLAIMVVFFVDMVFAYWQGSGASEQVKAAVTRCIQDVALLVATSKAGKIDSLDLDILQKNIKEARFWDSEIQKEGLVWTRLWQPAYKAESVPMLLDFFDEVYVWLLALQHSAPRCEAGHAASTVNQLLPQADVERCQTFVRAIKMVLQGLDESLHELHELLQGSEQVLERVSSQNICNLLQGEATGDLGLEEEGQAAGDAGACAALEAVKLSTKALRMTLQKIGGLLAAGSALAARDWRVEALRSPRKSTWMESQQPSLRRRKTTNF
ncbi:unnamed protein product [Effrenium voratum]|nr:unnamed protein product [Effrenium voratum]